MKHAQHIAVLPDISHELLFYDRTLGRCSREHFDRLRVKRPDRIMSKPNRTAQADFIGEPTSVGTNGAKFFDSFQIGQSKIHVGDTVEINTTSGIHIGLILNLWQTGKVRLKKRTEILWFELTKPRTVGLQTD